MAIDYLKMDVQEVIEIAKNSAQLLSQTLSFTDPTKEDISKNSLIQVYPLDCYSFNASTSLLGILC